MRWHKKLRKGEEEARPRRLVEDPKVRQSLGARELGSGLERSWRGKAVRESTVAGFKADVLQLEQKKGRKAFAHESMLPSRHGNTSFCSLICLLL